MKENTNQKGKMVNERGNRTEGRCLLPGPGNCSSAMSVIQLPATLFKSSLGSGSAIVNFPLIKRHALCGKTPGKQRKVGSADRCQLADEHGLLDQVADFFRHVVSASAHGRNPAQRRSFESQSGSSRKTRHVVGSCQSVLKSEPNSLAEDEPVIKNSTVRGRARTSGRRGGVQLLRVFTAVEEDD